MVLKMYKQNKLPEKGDEEILGQLERVMRKE
jgi:hypothetical protein